MKLNYQKYDFKRILEVVARLRGQLPLFFWIFGLRQWGACQPCVVRMLLYSSGSSLRVSLASHTLWPNLVRAGYFGSQPTHVGVFPKDPLGDLWCVVTGRLDTLFYILPIQDIFTSFGLPLTLSKPSPNIGTSNSSKLTSFRMSRSCFIVLDLTLSNRTY